jgi:PAS domain-containing protein
LHVDDHPVRKAAMTGKPVKDQLIALLNPGANELTWLLVSVEPVLKEDGQIYRMICTYHDITEQKIDEQALHKSKAKLEAALNSMTDAVFISDHKEISSTSTMHSQCSINSKTGTNVPGHSLNILISWMFSWQMGH